MIAVLLWLGQGIVPAIRTRIRKVQGRNRPKTDGTTQGGGHGSHRLTGLPAAAARGAHAVT